VEILRSDLAHGRDIEGAVVVIDVLRSFTTAAYAFAAGARAILVAGSPDEIPALRRRFPLALTTGARGGGSRLEGLDYGNSPSEIAPLDLTGSMLIQYTAGGIEGLLACGRASHVLAGSLVCASATVRYLRALDPPLVTLVVTGMWSDRDGDEDHACADLLAAWLCGGEPDLQRLVLRVRDSDFGRRFVLGTNPHLPTADLELAMALDRFDFAMPMRRTADGLLLEPFFFGNRPEAR
jgi:2-phosphosulfolactate phosphatase